MKVKETLTEVRPNTDIGWASDVTDKTHRNTDFNIRYRSKGLELVNERTVSEDGLTSVWVRVWKTEEAWNDYRTNSFTVALWEEYHRYSNEHGITLTITDEPIE